MQQITSRGYLLFVSIIFFLFTTFIAAQESVTTSELDVKVKTFLEEQEDEWSDMNIPVEDGKFMYDLIIENNFTSALEIGTSTGHSSIWIAWALSKTGGKLITIEIDEDRYEEAIKNFREVGLSEFIEARLADAHQLVKKLEGPFDFVFSDADKDWYKQYFVDVAPKMSIGGCYVTHNIRMSRVKDYVEYISDLPNFNTAIENEETSGISISIKTAQ